MYHDTALPTVTQNFAYVFLTTISNITEAIHESILAFFLLVFLLSSHPITVANLHPYKTWHECNIGDYNIYDAYFYMP